MANSKSARKRIKVAERNRLQNRYYNSAINTFFKKLNVLVNEQKIGNQNFNNIILISRLCESRIDKAVKKKILKKNTAARKKSKLKKIVAKVNQK